MHTWCVLLYALCISSTFCMSDVLGAADTSTGDAMVDAGGGEGEALIRVVGAGEDLSSGAGDLAGAGDAAGAGLGPGAAAAARAGFTYWLQSSPMMLPGV